MPELSHASTATVIVACIAAAAVAFFVGVAVTALIRRLAARQGIHVERRSIWRAPLALLLAVLAVRAVLLGAGLQREWVHPVGYILSLAAIAIVGWLLTVVAVGVERTLLGRYPDAGLEDRHSRHVRTKIILVTRVIQAVIVAITVAAMLWTIPPLRDISVGIFASAGVIGRRGLGGAATGEPPRGHSPAQPPSRVTR
jgi:hypothetical protein